MAVCRSVSWAVSIVVYIVEAYSVTVLGERPSMTVELIVVGGRVKLAAAAGSEEVTVTAGRVLIMVRVILANRVVAT